MAYRRKYKLADSSHDNVDLRKYRKLIVDTVNKTVGDKNPKVFKEYFSTDPLTQIWNRRQCEELVSNRVLETGEGLFAIFDRISSRNARINCRFV